MKLKRRFRISEVAELYNISTDTIRHYEKIGLINPKRDSNGYRIYKLNDIWRLNVIRDLRELKLPLEYIGLYLQNRNLETTSQLFEEVLHFLEDEIQRLKMLHKNVSLRMNTIKQNTVIQTGVIKRISYCKRRCFYLDESYSISEEADVLIRKLLNISNKSFLIGNNQIGSMLSLENVNKDPIVYDGVLMLSDNGTTIIPGGDYLVTTFRGNYSHVRKHIARLIGFAKANGLELTNPVLELYHMDIHATSEPADYLTELQIPVKAQ